MDLHHAGVVRRVAHAGVSAPGEGGTRRAGGCRPRGGGTPPPPAPLNPSSGNLFLSRCKTQKESKGKRKAFNSSDVFPGSRRRERPRPKAPPLAWGGKGGVSCSEPSGSAAATLPLVPGTAGLSPRVPLPGTVPAGRLSSLIASEAAGGCGLPPGDPCGAGGRWWHGGGTPDCAICSLPGREQGADTGGTERGSFRAQAGQGGK